MRGTVGETYVEQGCLLATRPIGSMLRKRNELTGSILWDASCVWYLWDEYDVVVVVDL